MIISRTGDARKERIDANAAWQHLQSAARIVVAKGKTVKEFTPQGDEQAVILKAVMGPSGNLRAPTLQIGDTFIVGFHEGMYEKELDG